jgi:hypothetical protein
MVAKVTQTSSTFNWVETGQSGFGAAYVCIFGDDENYIYVGGLIKLSGVLYSSTEFTGL